MARHSYYAPPTDWNVEENDEEVYQNTYKYWIANDKADIMMRLPLLKKMIKKYGGSGYTTHTDRSGSIFEVTNINVRGNNSKFKYNHHL